MEVILPSAADRWLARANIALVAAWSFVLVLFAAWLWVQGRDPSDDFQGFWPLTQPQYFHLLSGPAVLIPSIFNVILLRRRRALGSTLGKGLLLLTLAACAWGCGNAVWFYYNTCTGWGRLGCDTNWAVPFPSLADVGYLAVYPFLAAGLVMLGRVMGLSVRNALRMSWMAVPPVILATYVALPPTMIGPLQFGLGGTFSPGATVLQDILSTAFMMGDCIVVTGAVVLLAHSRIVAGGRFFRPLIVVAMSAVLLFVADMVFQLEVAGAVPQRGPDDVLYGLSMVVMTIGVMLVATRTGSQVPLPAGTRDATTMIDDIVASQVRVVGTVAYKVANRVPGLFVADDGRAAVRGEPSIVLADLVATYRSTTGAFGVDDAADRKPGAEGDGEMIVAADFGPAQRQPRHLTNYFVIVALMSFTWLLLVFDTAFGVPRDYDVPFPFLVAYLVVCTVFLLAGWFAPHQVRSRLGYPTLAYAFLVMIAIASYYTGGSSSDLTVLFAVPALWVASWAPRQQMAYVLGSIAVALVALALFSHPHHPWGLMLQIGLIVTFSAMMHNLISALRRQADEMAEANRSLTGLLDWVDQVRADERHEIAGEIHDFALQQILAALMHVRRLEPPAPSASGVCALQQSEAILQAAIDALRRIMRGLEPVSLYHLDLPTALRDAAVDIHPAYGTEVHVDAELEQLPVLRDQLTVYRLVLEAITNAAKHAKAANVHVRMAYRDNELDISIADDGSGFSRPIELRDELPERFGWGLRLMVERVRTMGGSYVLRSAPGQGTIVGITLPIVRAGGGLPTVHEAPGEAAVLADRIPDPV